MSGVNEVCLQAGSQCQGFVVRCVSAEILERVERVEDPVQRFDGFVLTVPGGPAGVTVGIFLLDMGGVEQNDPCQLVTGGSRDNLSAESTLDEEWQPTAMIEVGMGEEHEIDRSRIETEVLTVLFRQHAPSLIHPTIDQDAPPGGFNEVAGSGHLAVGSVERDLHGRSPSIAPSVRRMVFRCREALC